MIFAPSSTGWISDLVAGGRAIEDHLQLLPAGILHDELEEEAVELRFGKRIGSFLLERVLRRHHEERLFELADLPAGRHLLFLHRFEQVRSASWAWRG